MNTSIQTFIEQDAIANRFDQLFKDADQKELFKSTLVTLVNQNAQLAKANPITIVTAALEGAKMNLSINPNLGLAYIIPYYNNKTKNYEAQFQVGYKGFLELLHNTGVVKTIKAVTVYKGQMTKNDPLRGYVFDWNNKESDDVEGYVAYLALTSGFEIEYYMTLDEVKQHANRYSQSFKKNYGVWVDNFEAMAHKTVLKLLISKYAPKSISDKMQRALHVDQSVIRDIDGEIIDYVDNGKISLFENNETKEKDRLIKWINEAKDEKTLAKASAAVYETGDETLIAQYEAKGRSLSVDVSA